jgi:ParB-like chromosome segregation protein Spo0J
MRKKNDCAHRRRVIRLKYMKTTYKPVKYTVHPTAKLFPVMPDDQYRDLVNDINKRGQKQPILMDGSVLLDGLHRMQACEELKITPTMEQYKGADPASEIFSRNLFRRHLTDDQRALIGAIVRGPKLKEQAKERMESTLKKGELAPAASKSTQRGEAPDGEGRTAEKLSEETQTTDYKSRQALAVAEHGTAAEKKAVLKKGARLAAIAREVKERIHKKKVKSGKAKSKKKVDVMDENFIKGKFHAFMERTWAVTQFRGVYVILRKIIG